MMIITLINIMAVEVGGILFLDVGRAEACWRFGRFLHFGSSEQEQDSGVNRADLAQERGTYTMGQQRLSRTLPGVVNHNSV